MRKKVQSGSIGYFNLARGCGIVFVIAMHTGITFYDPASKAVLLENVVTNLGAGVMASFLIISGYGFFVRRVEKCIKTQAEILLKPYVITAGAVVLVKLLLSVVKHRPFSTNGAQNLIAYALGINAGSEGTVFGIQVDSISLFWFFLALFEGWVLYNCICQIKNEKMRTAMVCGSVLTGWGLTLISKVWVYAIPQALIVVGFLAFGEKCRKEGWLEKGHLPVLVYVVTGILSVVTLFFGRASFYGCEWKLGPIDIVGAACQGFLICRLFVVLSWVDTKNKIYMKLENIGANTLMILCIHAFEMKIIPWHRIGSVLENGMASAAVCFVMRSVCIFVLYIELQKVNRLMRKRRRGRRSIIIED